MSNGESQSLEECQPVVQSSPPSSCVIPSHQQKYPGIDEYDANGSRHSFEDDQTQPSQQNPEISNSSSVKPLPPPNSNIYVESFAFNQDGSCFISATSEGFRVYTCTPLFEFARRESLADPHWTGGPIRIAAMLYRTHLFALVSQADPRKVKLWDDHQGRCIGEIRSRQVINNVILGREVLVMVTDKAVYVYLAGPLTPLFVITTSYNPRGLCSLSPSSDKSSWRLACPTMSPGAIRIQTRENNRTSFIFQAHQSPIGCLALASSGMVIGSVSVLGTVLRLFSTIDGSKLYEFRLGSHPHIVRCISFRPDGRFVAVSSNSSTIHIFKLSDLETSSDLDGSQPSNSPSLDPFNQTSDSSTDVLRGVQELGEGDEINEPTSSFSTQRGGGNADRLNESSSYPYRPRNLSADAIIESSKAVSGGLSQPLPFTAVTHVYQQSKELVNETLKGVIPKFFGPPRSFSQFRIPVDFEEMDVRSCTRHALAEHLSSNCLECRKVIGDAALYDNGTPPAQITSLHHTNGTLPQNRLAETISRLKTSSFPLPNTPRINPSSLPLSRAAHVWPSTSLPCDTSGRNMGRCICPCGYGAASTAGPLCAFAGERSNHLFILHHDGFFYEIRFDPRLGGKCKLLSKFPWFAPRQTFSLKVPHQNGLNNRDVNDDWFMC